MEIERQCSLCDATYATLEELSNHMHEVHRPYSCNICFMHFPAEFELYDHRRELHQISSLGTPAQSDPSDRAPGPPQPATTAGTSDPADQAPEPPQQAETETEPGEPETPKKDKELKGNKRETKVFKILCPACNRYLRDLKTRRLHIRAYHAKKLKSCHHCKKSYLDPWDYNEHMKDNHVWCESCRGYTKDQATYDAHYKEKHEPAKKSPLKVTQREPTPVPEPEKEPEQEPISEPTGSEQVTDLPQSVVSKGTATSETDLEDRPFECKI